MTTPQTARAVIEEALWKAAHWGRSLEAQPNEAYVAANAPAVLQRVLAALGGKPVAFVVEDELRNLHARHALRYGDGSVRLEGSVYAGKWCGGLVPLYLHPVPPVDLAAVRALLAEMRYEGRQAWPQANNWADRLLRAIEDAK